jgi:polar amino acid transport system substrate-binding protein
LEETVITHTRKLLLMVAALFALTAFAAIACGDDEEDTGDAEPTAAATQPSSVEEIDISGVEELADGKLLVGSDIAYAPIEFFDEDNNAVGLDVDIAKAMGEVLGIEVAFEAGGFDALLPSLEAERYDIVMSAMSVNPERAQVVDFIEYFNAGVGVIVAAGNPKNIKTVDDLCGSKVAVQKGTVQVDLLQGTVDAPGGLDQKCKDAGKDGITVLEFDTDPEAVQALVAGQADAEMADFPVAAYSAQQNEGKIELVDTQVEPGPYGIAVRKSSTALRDALQKAFDAIVEDGTYAEILAKWDLTAGAIE